MKKILALIIAILSVFFSCSLVLAAEDSRLAFSSVHDIDLDDLAGGSVKQQRNSMLSFARGVSAQSVFILNAPVSGVQDKLFNWNPASHPELEVWMHQPLPNSPTAADFSGLANLPDNSSVKALKEGTANLSADKPSYLLSPSEIAQIGSGPHDVAGFWGPVLANRVQNFLSGHYHEPSFSYTENGQSIHPLSELKMLFRSDPKIFRQFQPLLATTPILSTGPVKPAKLYYEVFDVEGSAVLGTGAMFTQKVGDSVQIIDLEYYVNSTVYCTIEMYQLWPVQVQGKDQTLVWRGDFVSTGSVAYLHGMERMAASMLMLQDVSQAISVFRSELK